MTLSVVAGDGGLPPLLSRHLLEDLYISSISVAHNDPLWLWKQCCLLEKKQLTDGMREPWNFFYVSLIFRRKLWLHLKPGATGITP